MKFLMGIMMGWIITLFVPGIIIGIHDICTGYRMDSTAMLWLFAVSVVLALTITFGILGHES